MRAVARGWCSGAPRIPDTRGRYLRRTYVSGQAAAATSPPSGPARKSFAEDRADPRVCTGMRCARRPGMLGTRLHVDCSEHRAVHLLARTICRELLSQGYEARHLIELAGSSSISRATRCTQRALRHPSGPRYRPRKSELLRARSMRWRDRRSSSLACASSARAPAGWSPSVARRWGPKTRNGRVAPAALSSLVWLRAGGCSEREQDPDRR